MIPKFKTSQERRKYFYNHYYASLSTVKLHMPNTAESINDYVTELEHRLLKAIKTLEEIRSGEARYQSPVYDEEDIYHNIESFASNCLVDIRI